jgi:hypothetical protein
MSTKFADIAGSRRIGRSIGALLAGFAVTVVLSIGTDLGLQAAGLFPALGQPMSNNLLFLATAYRTLYGIVSGYIVARLAPHHPIQHALFGGLVGLVLSIIGAVATWNRGLGPHWYPLALIALALPPAWIGGKLHDIQQVRKNNARMAARAHAEGQLS